MRKIYANICQTRPYCCIILWPGRRDEMSGVNHTPEQFQAEIRQRRAIAAQDDDALPAVRRHCWRKHSVRFPKYYIFP
jgi:hypothetical protein